MFAQINFVCRKDAKSADAEQSHFNTFKTFECISTDSFFKKRQLDRQRTYTCRHSYIHGFKVCDACKAVCKAVQRHTQVVSTHT